MDIDPPKAAAATIHPRPPTDASAAAHPALPTLLQTPGGLALLELQGEFNLPNGRSDSDTSLLPIGRLEFPDYDPAAAGSTAWMGHVHLYVGPHQRLTGEAKKLPRPLAVVRRRRGRAKTAGDMGEEEDVDDDADENELEMVDVVHYKLLFSQRPEPMTESMG